MKYPKVIYTLNSVFRKSSEIRVLYPSDESLFKSLYFAKMKSQKNGTFLIVTRVLFV